MQADKMTMSLAVYCEREFGYTAVVRDNISDRELQKDGIHLTPKDYCTLTYHITTHVFENVHTSIRATQPLGKKWDFLDQGCTFKKHRKVRDMNNNITHTGAQTAIVNKHQTQKGKTRGRRKH